MPTEVVIEAILKLQSITVSLSEPPELSSKLVIVFSQKTPSSRPFFSGICHFGLLQMQRRLSAQIGRPVSYRPFVHRPLLVHYDTVRYAHLALPIEDCTKYSTYSTHTIWSDHCGINAAFRYVNKECFWKYGIVRWRSASLMSHKQVWK